MPALYVYNPGWGGAIMYRLKPSVNTQQAIAKIAAIFNKYNPSFPFEYRFADEAYSATYNIEVLRHTGKASSPGWLYLFPARVYLALQPTLPSSALKR